MKDNLTKKNTGKPDNNKETENKSFLKRLGLLSYFRELSVVIIGILITLSITNAINNYHRQEELKGMLKLVKDELKDNYQNLIWVQQRWEGEQRVFKYLKENIDNIERIPIDTLQKYSYALGSIYSFNSKNDSYDVLKNSTIKQYIKEKDLLPTLSNSYKRLDNLNAQLSIYSRRKTDSHDTMMEMMDADDAELYLNNSNPYEGFRYTLKERKYRSFLVLGGTILSPNIFEECKNGIEQAINDIEKYGY